MQQRLEPVKVSVGDHAARPRGPRRRGRQHRRRHSAPSNTLRHPDASTDNDTRSTNTPERSIPGGTHFRAKPKSVPSTHNSAGRPHPESHRRVTPPHAPTQSPATQARTTEQTQPSRSAHAHAATPHDHHHAATTHADRSARTTPPTTPRECQPQPQPSTRPWLHRPGPTVTREPGQASGRNRLRLGRLPLRNSLRFVVRLLGWGADPSETDTYAAHALASSHAITGNP